MTEAVIIGILAFTAWREWQNAKERSDLYSRIMARDLTDYEAARRAEIKGKPPPKEHGGNFIVAGLAKHYDRQRAGDD